MQRSVAYKIARWGYQPIKEAQRIAVEVRCSRLRRETITKYLAGPGFKGLHIGCGPFKKAGWLNTDLPGEKTAADIGLDITRSLPFPTACFDAIYGSEVIEHIPKESAVSFLKDAWRSLKPGGTIRLTTPDVDQICRITLGLDEHCSISDLSTVWLENPGGLTRDEWINAMFRNWGHQYLWSQQALEEVLREAGFDRIDRVAPLSTKTNLPELRGLEDRYGVPFPSFAWRSSMILEATKKPQ